MTMRTLTVLAVLVLGLVGAGCGGDDGGTAGGDVDTQAFEQAAQDARTEIEAALGDIDVTNVGDLPGELEAAAGRIDEVTGPLEDAEVPEEAEPAREDLVQAIEDLSAELEQTAQAVEEGDVQQALQDVQGLDALDRVQQALADLEAAGIDVGRLEGEVGG